MPKTKSAETRPPEPDPEHLARFPSIGSFRAAARRRLPRFAFDYLDGACGEEEALRRNVEAFGRVLLKPRFGVDVSEISTEVELLGRRWSSPIGISPVGYGNMYWPGAEEALAAAAQAANVPFAVSTVTIKSLETLAALAPDVLWFQLYHLSDMSLTEDLVRRARAVGVHVLLFTIDLPTHSKRNRDLVNRFTMPFRPGLKFYSELVRAPLWSLATLRAGLPYPATLVPYGPPGLSPSQAAAMVDPMLSTVTTWEHVERIRALWPGKFVVKGVLRPDDAGKAVAAGADGIIVSNHGGRQFDAAPASIDVLPEIAREVGGKVPLLLDSGVRGGLDVLRGLVRGASLVLSGRSFYSGAAAMGPAGGRHALAILHAELESNMRQMGVRSLAELRSDGPWEWPGR
jgi:isopentenyl diphosphate isomerase/L-lactate dehydrogenase-like FMN-dependent dehydrogenase